MDHRLESKIELKLKVLWYCLAFVSLLIVAVASLLPGGPDMGDVDKITHFVTYAILSAGFSIIVQNRGSLWIVLFGLIGYGLLIENLQGLTGYRTADFFDAIANIVGVVCGLFVHFTPLHGSLRKIDQRLYEIL